jgi:methylenetetrahydrofolate dehydrogenase (NADP+) / methenyltetrahydrofolate cyclohydrolase
MTHQSMAIDGRGIQSERLRDLRLHQHRFAEFEVFFFVPEPRTRGASEAFISAREKQRVFTAAGFRCTVCRVGEDAASRGLRAIESGKAFYIVQRPLEPHDVLEGGRLEALDLDARSPERSEVSALTDTVSRIVWPFIERRRAALPSQAVRIGVVGSKGFFGREISSRLLDDGIEVYGLDLGEDASAITGTHIVISAVGKPGVVSKKLLGAHKDLLVDVGYSYNESEGRGYGDFDPSCYCACEFYTPVPGGVGPLQVLTLVERAVGRTGHLSYLPWSLPMIEGRLAFAD